MYAQYDALVKVRKRAEQELLEEARRHPIAKVLQSCPGLRLIRVAQIDSDCHDAGTFSHQTTNQLPKEPLHADYQKLLVQGTKPNLAKLTLARRIASITLALWKTREEYDPAKVRKQSP